MFQINQADIIKLAGVSVKSALIDVIDNARDADVQADPWFQHQGLPVPPAPQPVQPLSPPQPELVPLNPGAVNFPEYPAAAFLPTLTLHQPAWTDGQNQQFVVTSQTAHTNLTGTATVSFRHMGGRWQTRSTVSDSTGAKLTDAWAQ